jgi:hypothetical protein
MIHKASPGFPLVRWSRLSESMTYSLRAHFAMPVMRAHTPVTCTPASIKVHWRLTVSTAVFTQLVTHLARLALWWLDR